MIYIKLEYIKKSTEQPIPPTQLGHEPPDPFLLLSLTLQHIIPLPPKLLPNLKSQLVHTPLLTEQIARLY
jgi:hypothetical protein